ncbi:MAG: Histidine ammonia-lyase [Phycisphaerae bacterium]|nr:Histidine ammonia-lyase [Phycisphaerae bacterium]
MTRPAVMLDGETIDPAWLDRHAGQPLRVEIGARALERVARARGWVESLIQRGGAVYGLNTGFGQLRRVRIEAENIEQLQENLIVSHAVGVGPPAPSEIVRLMLLFKLHMLLAGHSGVRVETVRLMAGMLSNDLLPEVPTRGSLGASGDLAPLAHLVLPMIGRGTLRTPGGVLPAAGALAACGLAPLRLAAKEGLALINGTQFMSAYAAEILVRASRLADLADVIGCMSLEGLRGSIRPMDPRLHALRPHPGAARVAANVRRCLADSEVLESHRDCDRVQDPYSVRCLPQVHGAFRDTLEHFTGVVVREINSVTDNPVLFENDAISGGNFHGAPIGMVLDFLAIALTDLASISERRIYLLLSGEDGLPNLLMADTGLNSGFMLPQYTAAALVSECKILASPASVDSIPTSLGQEDHVSMGATAAVKCRQVLEHVETVLAIEMMCAAQAIDFRAPLRPGVGPRAAHEIVRARITHADRDRAFGEDIAAALEIVRGGELIEAARRILGDG